MTEKRFCLQCDDGTELVHGHLDMPITVGTITGLVASVSGWHCPICGECEFDESEAQRYADTLNQLRERAAICQGQALRTARKRLHLSQRDAGLLFGGGASAFSEYERGKTQPHKSTILLLGLLEKHPELICEIRPDGGAALSTVNLKNAVDSSHPRLSRPPIRRQDRPSRRGVS
ncbi:MAG: type II TA system antitoxin MqsA family protein [Acidiferrobacter sp.]